MDQMTIDIIRQLDLLQARVDGLIKPEVPLAAGIRPLFSAYNSATDSNVTGDGTVYAIICDTEIVDRNSNYNNATGVFTAPVDGYYSFVAAATLTNIGAGHILNAYLVTSNRIYYPVYQNAVNVAAGGTMRYNLSVLGADMDAADTAYYGLIVSGGAKTVDVFGAASPTIATFFQGYLLI